MMNRKILFFYPHNPFPPKSGSHRRCVEMIKGSRDLGYEIHFASSSLFSDTRWDMISLNDLAKKQLITSFELYHAVAFDQKWIQFWLRFYKLMNISPPVKSYHYCPPLMIAWFRRTIEKITPDIILMNYAFWDRLINHRNTSIHSVIEIHDLVSMNQKMRKSLTPSLKKVLKDENNINNSFLDQNFFKRNPFTAATEEFKIYDRYDHTISLSSKEAKLIRKNTKYTSVVSLPMTFSPQYIANTYLEPPIFVVGPNPFNIQGYFYFIKKILPLILTKVTGFSLNITGTFWGDFIPKNREGILFRGFVPDIGKIYRGAKFAICPTFGGTGQQIKIIEAMAYGVAVVALADPAQDSALIHGVNGFIAHNAEEFAEYAIKLWRDKNVCRKLGKAARETICNRYSRDKLLETLSLILSPAMKIPIHKQ